MATYLILNASVLALLIAFALWAGLFRRSKPVMSAVVILGLLTAVFDNLIIKAGIVVYDTAKISGLYLVQAPIEDFAYTLGAVLVVALLWNAMEPGS
jgi:lycopene cyclase domain-containing protein